MTHHELLERRNEILKKQVSKMILKENKNHGLTKQDALLRDRIIKQLHHTSHDLKSSDK